MPVPRSWILAAIVAVAFLLRLSAGLSRGPDFVDHGYSFYADIARTFWDGDGLCYAPGIECAQRMPLYPLLVSPFIASGTAYPWLIVLKAAIGALHALLVYALATSLFSTRIALVAAAAAAANPYAVVHGPSFQDTVVFNALMTAAVYLLIRTAATRSLITCLLAGIALALAMLTVVRMMLFVPVALAWVWYAWREEGWRRQLIGTGLAAAPIVLLLGAWVERNQRVVGAPVLTTEAGLSLWLANNGATMRVLPNRSVDLVEALAWSELGLPDRQRLGALSDSPVALDRL
jgi:4-amino-4-deoxy-L-arabinose transferase-like glycosyltransferase